MARWVTPAYLHPSPTRQGPPRERLIKPWLLKRVHLEKTEDGESAADPRTNPNARCIAAFAYSYTKKFVDLANVWPTPRGPHHVAHTLADTLTRMRSRNIYCAIMAFSVSLASLKFWHGLIAYSGVVSDVFHLFFSGLPWNLHISRFPAKPSLIFSFSSKPSHLQIPAKKFVKN